MSSRAKRNCKTQFKVQSNDCTFGMILHTDETRDLPSSGFSGMVIYDPASRLLLTSVFFDSKTRDILCLEKTRAVKQERFGLGYQALDGKRLVPPNQDAPVIELTGERVL